MKRKVMYECEVCHFASEDEELIKECEAQGIKKPKFKKGQEVNFLMNPNEPMRVIVLGPPDIEELTHTLIYSVRKKSWGKENRIPLTASENLLAPL